MATDVFERPALNKLPCPRGVGVDMLKACGEGSVATTEAVPVLQI